MQVNGVRILGAFLLGFVACLNAQSISLTSPTVGQSISGTSYQFASTLTNLPSVYSVEYDVNGTDGLHVACIARSAPWGCAWDTYYSFGGPYNYAIATARDALNNTLATSATVTFTVSNPLPVPASVFSGTVTPPASWTGTVSFGHTFTGTDASSGSVALFVDGQPSSGGVLGCCNVITTNYDNGPHLVRLIGFDSKAMLGGRNQWSAALEWEQKVTFSNGATPMELRMSPGYEVFLCTTASPNCPTSIALTGKVYKTDETSSSATFPSAPTISTGPTYPTAPVTVSSCSSCTSVTVSAQAVGSVQLAFTESGGKTRTVWVHVNTQNILPHFGSDGSILTSYNPSKSIFTASVFQSAGSAFGDSLYPAAFNYSLDMANSGLNTAEFGCNSSIYNNTTQSQFQTAQISYVASIVALLAPYGLYWHCTGDGLMRGTPEAFGTTRGASASWSPPAVQYTFSSLIGQRVLSVHMIDEANSIWGDKPLQGNLTWGNGLTGLSCVSGGSCTVTCSSFAQSNLTLASGCSIQPGDNAFIITGSGDLNLDYNTTSGAPNPIAVTGTTNAPNGGYSQFTFATPTGVGTKTYTSSANPNLIINWAVAWTYDSAGNACPPGGSTPGPCTNWVHDNAFSQFMSQANAATGRPKITWDVQGGYNAASIQNWMGDPNIADFSQVYYLGNAGTYAAAGGSVYNSFENPSTGIGDAFAYRNRYAALGPAARLTPVLGQGKGTPIDYGLQGYPIAVASIAGDLVTFAAPHGITTVLPWDTRLWISGNSNAGANTNFYIRDCPTTTTCHVVFPKFNFTASYLAGAQLTATADSGSTFAVNNIYSTSGGVGRAQNTVGSCVIPNYRGHTFTVTGTGTTLDSTTMWLIPAPMGAVCNLSTGDGIMAQVPALASGTGGTATIVQSSAYTRGVNWIGPGSSEDGPRYAFDGAVIQYLMGAAGFRIYQTGISYDNPAAQSSTANFQSTNNIDIQAGLHPRYGQYGDSQQNWHANSMAAKLAERLAPCLFEPRGSGPDYGQFFEATVRISSTCNMLMVLSMADGVLTRTIDLTPIVVGGQPTVKYCAGWRGIAVSTIPAGTTSDSNSFDPDSCAVAAYVGAPSASNWYSPPVISAKLSDVPNAASVVIQWTYSPIQFAAAQVNSQALYQTYSLGSGTGAPPIDCQIGPVYYRLLYLDQNSIVLATSDVQIF